MTDMAGALSWRSRGMHATAGIPESDCLSETLNPPIY